MSTRRKGFRVLALLLIAVMSFSFAALPPAVPFAHAGSSDLSGLADRAANYLYNEFVREGAKNGDSSVGSYAVWTLTQAGVDVSAWLHDGTSLKDAVIEIITQDIADPEVSVKVLAQDLLAAQALERQDLAEELLEVLKNREQSTGGFDYNVYSDMPAYDLLGRSGKLDAMNTDYARNYILSTQNKVYASIPEAVYESVYGSWGMSWDGVFYPDFITTAQAIRALSYLDPLKEDPEIRAAVDLGLQWLKKQQKEDGSFAVSDWEDPLINTVEMVATLEVLEIDPSSLTSNTGKSPVDYLIGNALNPDGSFGTSKNAMDATWALWGYWLLGGRVQNQLFMEPTSASLSVGEKVYFKSMLNGSDVTQDAVWTVGEQSIASVAYGLVTGLKAGTTVVSAAYGGLTGSAVLTVKSPVPPGGTSTYTVEIAVVGMDGELLYGPGPVTISAGSRWGMTALGALDATDLPYSMSDQWPDFIESIAGQAGSGMAGWCYVVNGNIPSVAAAKYDVRDGDRIIWYYSKDINEPPPKWDDLVKRAASGTVSPSAAVEEIADLLTDLEKSKLTPGEVITGIGDLLDQLGAAEATEELKSKLAEAVNALSLRLAKIPDEALSVRTDGATAKVEVDGDAIKNQVSAVKSAVTLAEKLEQIGVNEVGNLALEQIVVKLPTELASQKGFTVELPAEAGEELVSANLGLAVEGPEVSLSLPPEVLKKACDTAPNLAGLELAVARREPSKLNPFKGASVVGNVAFDLEANTITAEGKKESLKGSFSKKVTVTLSLEGIDLGGIDRGRLAVYRQKGDGSWEFVGGSLSADEKSYSFETDHLSVYSLMEFQNPFKDVTSHWARETIELMAMRLIARGISEDSFAPDQKLSRAQFAAFLVRALDVEEETPQVRTFSDVPPDHWGYRAIEAAFREGLVAGTGAGRFEPERAIKREEMAVILAAVLKRNGIATALTDTQRDEVLKGYGDSDRISEWAKEGLAVCVSKGIIKGRAEAALAPLGSATRAEAVVVLENLLRLLGKL
ncbi:amylopullulanase AmyB [Thermacetogenium phaeum DSM 12270]|uniref:Amylopullulanase AmyB n=1 Tax=Thermacetogenium phaeum (strain ATCC BAA-254 / DSM 26808 / PB) TaxID=1089553 RepID=K4LR48_THEPS|nr:S-layer homology domain-containing protein [Thermacetogenium phaeum]AFV10574.1 amylopullulanase AmyB [Thermacetogenium phaeum DSM 12270]